MTPVIHPHKLPNWGKMGFVGEAVLQEPFIQVCGGSELCSQESSSSCTRSCGWCLRAGGTRARAC